MTSTITLYPAMIAAITTFALFIIKDLIYTSSQRNKYGRKLLIHSCRTLQTALTLPPTTIDIKAAGLDSYIDVYLKCSTLEGALNIYMDTLFLWKTGYYTTASVDQIDQAKAKLKIEIDKLCAV